MESRLNAYGAYNHEYHVVRIPKYRKRILKGEVKSFIEKRIFDIQEYHPDVEIERYSIRERSRSSDHNYPTDVECFENQWKNQSQHKP